MGLGDVKCHLLDMATAPRNSQNLMLPKEDSYKIKSVHFLAETGMGGGVLSVSFIGDLLLIVDS